MEFVKLTGEDGARVEVNPVNILYMRKSAAADQRFVEIVSTHGEKLLVRQTLDQILKALGIERTKQAAAQ